jgi:transcriptional regulator GlxA family with amidase domain
MKRSNGCQRSRGAVLSKATSRLVGIVGYPGVMALDVIGPFDAFATASAIGLDDTPLYRCLLIGPTREPFAAASGVLFTPNAELGRAPAEFDTIIVPGGPGILDPANNARIASWLKRRAPHCRRIASVCTGIYALAATGMLDGRRAATHWQFVSDFRRRFPAVDVDPDAIFVESAPFWTSAGVTAGIDLALALIEADHGPEVALEVARELVVYLKREGGQAQYSAPLRFQVAARGRLAGLIAWMSTHPEANLSVERLAEKLATSPRNLTRQFVKAFGMPPGRVVEVLRLDAARTRIATTRGSIDGIAESVGFRSGDVFRRAFKRRFSTSPRNYRDRFRMNASQRSSNPEQ